MGDRVKEPKLMICIGKDKNEQPIYKEVKKVIIQHIDKNNVISMNKGKPFWNGQYWMIRALGKLFFISKQDIFFDKRLNYYIFIKNLAVR